jgi:hypothetical protein
LNFLLFGLHSLSTMESCSLAGQLSSWNTKMPQDLLTEPWRRGLVAIVPANGTEDHLFESRQGVRLFTCRCKLKSSDTMYKCNLYNRWYQTKTNKRYSLGSLLTKSNLKINWQILVLAALQSPLLQRGVLARFRVTGQWRNYKWFKPDLSRRKIFWSWQVFESWNHLQRVKGEKVGEK